MIQHRGSIKKLFIYNTDNSKNKRVIDKHKFVLTLKMMCFYFSKQTNNNSGCPKKKEEDIVKSTPFLLNMLLIDFTVFITQKFFKKSCLLCKITMKKVKVFYKNICVFIKNSVYIFLPQHRLKEQ